MDTPISLWPTAVTDIAAGKFFHNFFKANPMKPGYHQCNYCNNGREGLKFITGKGHTAFKVREQEKIILFIL
jgi:hypothetical protein